MILLFKERFLTWDLGFEVEKRDLNYHLFRNGLRYFELSLLSLQIHCVMNFMIDLKISLYLFEKLPLIPLVNYLSCR
jgi:hypothetical protein